MKKHLIYVLSSLLWLCIFCTSAFAQNCPPGTQKVINPKTDEVLCYVMDDQNKADNTESSYEEDMKISREISSNGGEINIGIGYGMVGAFDLRLAGGYHVNIPGADNVSFGIYTDFSIRFPYPNSLDWAIVPMMHVHGDIFRASFGLGIGIFSFFIEDEDYYEDEEFYSTILFQLKPEVKLDWFLSEHVLIGMNIDLPLILYKKEIHDWGNARPKKITATMPWFSLTFHVGYKF